MIGLDTNVLCRYLLADDVEQTRRAAQIIEPSPDGGCHIVHIVLCELVWVLESSRNLKRSDVARTLRRLLQVRQFSFEGPEQVLEALGRYEAGRGDLADHLIGTAHRAAACSETITFDRGLRGERGFRLL